MRGVDYEEPLWSTKRERERVSKGVRRDSRRPYHQDAMGQCLQLRDGSNSRNDAHVSPLLSVHFYRKRKKKKKK